MSVKLYVNLNHESHISLLNILADSSQKNYRMAKKSPYPYNLQKNWSRFSNGCRLFKEVSQFLGCVKEQSTKQPARIR